MAAQIRLILTLHNHQPIGNFGGVFEEAYRESYAPFLDLLEEFPEIPVVLHTSGSLLEWLETARPEYIQRVRSLVARGQVEVIGGPYYEPILAAIPRRDRVAQIQLYREHLEDLFETEVRGLWIPERVWEQSFVCDIVDAGMEYTLLDDAHFRSAGVADDQLYGFHLTEDSGRLLKVFAGSERLRYLIPFADPHEIVGYCRSIAERYQNAVLVFGDDGEKFGVWPGSKEHCWTRGWLRRFFTALRGELSWLKVTTMADAVNHTSPLGRQYLPDASYREMMTWALPTDRQHQWQQAIGQFEGHPEWWRMQGFVRTGQWRNFLVKYPESNEMYTRMLQVSRRLEACEASGVTSPSLDEARRELFRGQCNCPYWHGAFGGLYLPHLRNAIYSRLIAADTILDQLENPDGRWCEIAADDFNADGRKEVRLANEQMVAYFSPARGGHLYELDLRLIGHNLLSTLNRRPEPYHEKIRQLAGQTHLHLGAGGGVDPNGGVRFKQPDLDQKLIYDHWPRKSLVDHFLQPRLSRDRFVHGAGGLADFAQGVYRTVLRREPDSVELEMSRVGRMGPYEVEVTKCVRSTVQRPGDLEIEYRLSRLPAGLPIHFAVEFNFAGMAAAAHDRYFYHDSGRQLGTLEVGLDLPATHRLGLVDEWLGLDVSLESSVAAGIWTLPIQTVSQSEGGFELVHQSTAVVPHWEFAGPADGCWSTTLTLSCDLSLAQARRLPSAELERAGLRAPHFASLVEADDGPQAKLTEAATSARLLGHLLEDDFDDDDVAEDEI